MQEWGGAGEHPILGTGVLLSKASGPEGGSQWHSEDLCPGALDLPRELFNPGTSPWHPVKWRIGLHDLWGYFQHCHSKVLILGGLLARMRQNFQALMAVVETLGL